MIARLLRAFEYVERLLVILLNAAALAAFATFVILIVHQVVSRNIRAVPVILWTEEISRFSFMWMIMLGATIGVLHSDHFLIEIFGKDNRARVATIWLKELLLLVVAIFFILEGYQFGLTGARRISMAAGLPMTYVYMSFFVMGLFATFFCIHRLLILVNLGIAELDKFDDIAPLVSADETSDVIDIEEKLIEGVDQSAPYNKSTED